MMSECMHDTFMVVSLKEKLTGDGVARSGFPWRIMLDLDLNQDMWAYFKTSKDLDSDDVPNGVINQMYIGVYEF